jgi:hypothetical protein
MDDADDGVPAVFTEDAIEADWGRRCPDPWPGG